MDAATLPVTDGALGLQARGSRRPRLLYIDWLRGVAVVAMIVWHTLDAWTLPADRTNVLWDVIILIGGSAAPLFLFLAGVSVALGGDAQLRRYSREAAGWQLQKRGWQVFGIAHLFRLQSFLLNPAASWSGLIKPDILNILGLGIVVAAFCWTRAQTRVREIVWLLFPAAAIVLMTPSSRRWLWPEWLLRSWAPRIEAYIHPVGTMGVFTLFPWVGLVLAGTYVGIAISRLDPSRFPKPLAITGAATIAAGIVGKFLPSLTPSEFWTTSLSYFLIRVGMMTLAMPLAWLWLQRKTRWSPMLLFGRASLFVYWVHVELAYGAFTHPIQRALPLAWSLTAFFAFTLALLALTQWWVNRQGPLIPAFLRATPSTEH